MHRFGNQVAETSCYDFFFIRRLCVLSADLAPDLLSSFHSLCLYVYIAPSERTSTPSLSRGTLSPPHHLSLWESFGKIQSYAGWLSPPSSDTVSDGDMALNIIPTLSSDAVFTTAPQLSTLSYQLQHDIHQRDMQQWETSPALLLPA